MVLARGQSNILYDARDQLYSFTGCGKFPFYIGSSQLLEVCSLCNQLGSQNALLLQAIGLQVTNFA
jgi:hypothetical protein